MKLFIITVAAVLAASAACQAQELLELNPSAVAVERRVHPSLVTSCVTEQLGAAGAGAGQLDTVHSCISCFQEVGDPLAQEGIDRAKNCTYEWLPRSAAECGWELNNTVAGDEDRSQDLLSCFTDVRFVMAAEACLERSYYLDYEEDPVTTLTEGVVCLQESQRNLTNILEFIFRGPEVHTEEFLAASEQQYVETGVEEEEVEMADQMSSLVHQRHCNIAASTKGSNRSEAEAACNACFDAAAHPSSGSVPRPQEYVAALASCSSAHLAPQYDDCSELLTELAFNEAGHQDHNIGRDIFLCFTRVVDRHQVEECSRHLEVAQVDAWTLLDVMVCNEAANEEWVVDHVTIGREDTAEHSGEEVEETTDTGSGDYLDLTTFTPDIV